MKRISRFLLLLTALALWGCGSSSNNDFVFDGQPIPPIARQEAFLVAGNLNAGGIQVFRVDLGTGGLAPVSGSPFALGSSFFQVAYDTQAQTVYGVEIQSGEILGFRLDPATGALSTLPGFPVATSTQEGSIAIDLEGDHLYIVGDTNIDGFRVDRATGSLQRLADFPIQVPGLVDGQVGKFAANGFLYVTDEGSEQIFSFFHNEATGGLTLVTQTPTGNNDPQGIGLDQSGNFLYVAEGDGTIAGFRANLDGSLTALNGFPVTFAPAGAFSYAFAFDQGNMYVGDGNSDTLNAFRIGADGGLTPLAGYPIMAGARGVYSYPQTPFLYLSSADTNLIRAIRVDAQGNQSTVPGSPFAGSGGPTTLAPAVTTF